MTARDVAGRDNAGGGRLLVLTGAVLWGTAGVAVTLGPDDATVLQIATARLVLGAAILLVATAGRAEPARPRGASAVVAGVALAGFQLGYFTAIDRIGVAFGTLIAIGTSPVFAGAVERSWSGVVPERRWWPATGLGIVGLLLLLAPTGTGVVDLGGLLAGLVAGVSFATFTVASRRTMSASVAPAAAMGWLLAVAALALTPLAIGVALLTDAPIGWLAGPAGLGMLAWLVGASTVTAYWLFGRGLTVVPASTAATLVLAEPLTAVLLGIGLLGERPTVVEGLGGCLLLGGLVVVGRRRSAVPGSR